MTVLPWEEKLITNTCFTQLLIIVLISFGSKSAPNFNSCQCRLSNPNGWSWTLRKGKPLSTVEGVLKVSKKKDRAIREWRRKSGC